MRSPLRYPGGKGSLATFINSVIDINEGIGCQYYEPFAGGAGAGFRLLSEEKVSALFLNDADPCIYAFWKSALWKTEQFVSRILNSPLTIQEWQKQRAIYLKAKRNSLLDVGFATFYLNRCNRSGILTGAGPIGGYAQEGDWKLDARFNREKLATRILKIREYRDVIKIHNLDALVFLSKKLPIGKRRQNVFVYLDPPYFTAGQRLYYNSFKNKDHRDLARYILRQKTLKWMMSYDNCDFIRRLYIPCQKFLFLLRYSLQKKKNAQELLILPNHLRSVSNKKLKEINMNLRKVS